MYIISVLRTGREDPHVDNLKLKYKKYIHNIIIFTFARIFPIHSLLRTSISNNHKNVYHNFKIVVYRDRSI